MKRPLPLDPASFAVQTAHLTPRELGALLRMSLHFWRLGTLPDGGALAEVAGVTPHVMDGLQPRLMPFFEPGALFPILREASLAKAARRAAAGSVGGKIGMQRRWHNHESRQQ